MKKRRTQIIAGIVLVSMLCNLFSGGIHVERTKATNEENGGTGSIVVEVKEHSKQPFQYKNCKVEMLCENYIQIQGTNRRLQQVKKALEQRCDVVSVQKDYSYCLQVVQEEKNTNDPKLQKQWGLWNDGTYVYTNSQGKEIQAVAGVDCKVKLAWEQFQSSQEDEEVLVAVIDTGIDYQHEDLKDSMWKNKKEIPGNGIDDDNNGYIDDVYGWDFYNNDASVCTYSANGKAKVADNDNHGTHCAGTIAATANNGVGIAGIVSNVNVKIMALKAMGGVNEGTSTSKLIKAIKYAMNNGADIVNASWGGEMNKGEDLALKKVMAGSGLLFVCSAGNCGQNKDVSVSYPASYNKDLNNVIAVGSIDCDGKVSDFSNYGKSVDIMAPGSGIYGTSVGGYATMSGTSMAAPFVTGVAAMLYAGKDYRYPADVKRILSESYTKLDTLSEELVANAGIINALAAVEKRSELKEDKQPPRLTLPKKVYTECIKVEAEDLGESGIACVLYARGNHTLSYFRHGARGDTVENGQVTVEKNGSYSFYSKDQAGNETIATCKVDIDKKSPVLKIMKKKKKTYVVAKDTQSGLKKAWILPGKHTRKEIKHTKKGIGIKKKKRVRGKWITFYAEDQAGNVTFSVCGL